MTTTRNAKGLRPGIEGLAALFDLKPGKVITNHFDAQDGLAALKDEQRQVKANLNAMRVEAPRNITGQDAETVAKSVRKGEAPDIGPDPLIQIDDAIRANERMLRAIDLAEQTVTIEITQQLRTGSYLEKLHKAWAKEYAWEPSDDTTHGEVEAHRGSLEAFVKYAISLVVALEVAAHSDATPQEMKTLRKEMQALPEVLPSIISIRAATRSRQAEQVVDKTIAARKEVKVVKSELDKEEAAEAARYRASGRTNQAAANSDVQERMAAHSEKVKADAAATK